MFMKISKASSLRKSRIHGSYVDRNNQISRASGVEAVDPIKKIENSSFYSSENHLTSYDLYYDNLKELKKEYKRFYHNEQSLERAIENLKENKDKLAEKMEDLISKYNEAILSLVDFDRVFDTSNVSKIISTLNQHKKQLNKLGIYIVRDKELEMDKDIFIDRIKESPNALDLLFKPTHGLVMKLYYIFRGIKLPQKNSLENRFSNPDYKGVILDNKT